MAILADGLLPASFRGVPFAVERDDFLTGRRLVNHSYPGKDDPFPEDMGRAPRTWGIRGFIVDGDVQFLGGPIQLQRLLLITALEKKGPGLLTHPSLGIKKVVVRRANIGADLGAARKSLVEIEFLESGQKVFPKLGTSGLGKLLSAANLMKLALVLDGVRLIAAAVTAIGGQGDVAGATSLYSAQAASLGADATSLQRLAAQLPGSYGRFAGGGNNGLSGQRATIYTPSTTIGDLVSVASASRTDIEDCSRTLAASVDDADPNAIAQNIISLVQSLADACADPADAIRLLESLIEYGPSASVLSSAGGIAVTGLFQRAAVAALVTVTGTYQPSSADDAAVLASNLADLLDALSVTAADAGDDASYDALRAARAAIVTDLRERGGELAEVKDWTFQRPLPALVLAQRMYQDAGRADQLVGQVPACIHPLFMPTTFQALSS